MDICSGALADVVRVLNADFGWVCEPLSDERAVLVSGRRYADSEPVEVHVLVREDLVVLSDGGELVSRLASAGFDLDDPVHQGLWREALWEFRLAFGDGLVQVTASLATAAHAAAKLADGLLGLDTLRLVAMPKVARPKTFADSVEEYLRGMIGEEAVTRSPRVSVSGITVRPTLLVAAKKGPVYVQTAATTSWTQAYEHAFYMFSLMDRAEVPAEQRLVVLGGTEATWTRPRLEVLSEVAYVALWSERRHVDSFLAGQTPGNRLLLADR